ncbi:hypothetical protein NQZ68_025531 [Dissostichus eleginoides]|nr:hypothetical protein NQZ68_025531 [Dissostichus eleginoides]
METSLKPLSLSRRTKGSCNFYSRGLTAVAVNVTGYNGRRFSDTELRGRGSRGAPEDGSSWFNRAGGVSSFTGAVCTQLRFPVAFAPGFRREESPKFLTSYRPPDSLESELMFVKTGKYLCGPYKNPKPHNFRPLNEDHPDIVTTYERDPGNLHLKLKHLDIKTQMQKRSTDSSVISVGFTLGHRTDREGCVRFRGRIFCRCGRHTRRIHCNCWSLFGISAALRIFAGLE